MALSKVSTRSEARHSVLSRYELGQEISKRTTLTDNRTGVRIIDTEDSFSYSLPLARLLFAVLAAVIGIAALFMICRCAANRKKVIRKLKGELKRIRRRKGAG